MVADADADMLSGSNLRALDEAHLCFIVGSRMTKAPIDLASPFHWHGDAFADGQLIGTIPQPAVPARTTRACAPNRSGSPPGTRAPGGRVGLIGPSRRYAARPVVIA